MNPLEFQPGITMALAARAKSKDIRDSDGKWLFRLERDAWSHLKLIDAAGNEYSDVAVIPLFPVSAAKEWISISSADSEELACLPNLDSISDENRALIEEELSYREFVPHIERVIRISGNTEPCEWVVQTNHGVTSFVIKAEEDVRRISAFSVNIIDANGVRFRVDDMRKLDSRSRAFIEWYV